MGKRRHVTRLKAASEIIPRAYLASILCATVLVYNLIKRVSDNAGGAGAFEGGDKRTFDLVINNHLDALFVLIGSF
jgi:hypothetical protein